MNKKRRIEWNIKTVEEAVLVISGGNPKAIIVCAEIIAYSKIVNKNIPSFLYLFLLDRANIWEEKIWILFKDVCGMRIEKMIALLLAYRLNLAGINNKKLHNAIKNRDKKIDFDTVIKKVKKHFPNFNPNALLNIN